MSEQLLRARIFDIGRFRGTDGPGIRTIVFFKGCPLRCLWCSNAFGLSSSTQLAHSSVRCVGCGLCVPACPQGAISCFAGQCQTDRNLCTACGACVLPCLQGARQRIGQELSIDALYAEVKKDQGFYRRSKGGVTLSGGEVLMQHEAAVALLRLCRADYMDTCIETSAFAPWAHLEALAGLCHLVFVDLKHIDDTAHQKGCGVSNALILENIEKLCRLRAETGFPRRIVLRLPLIPDFNCDTDSLQRTATFLAGLAGKPEINLLPYHRLGAGKYAMLGEDYALADLEAPTKDDALMQNALRIFASNPALGPVTLGGEAILPLASLD